MQGNNTAAFHAVKCMDESMSMRERGFISAIFETILAGGGVLLLLLWLGKRRRRALSGLEETKKFGKEQDPKTKYANKQIQTVFPIKSEKSTQTEHQTIWKAVIVGEDMTDELVSNRHLTELRLDFGTGQVTRTEQVYRTRNSHILTKV
ncbi:unnamed protein product [Clavelina lepadiformis]|uniref:Uncharacterized protein n=1 Tax=Clavelina lepadiformis TaxID=159417 RepID=A0ABP0FUB9_CLALP